MAQRLPWILFVGSAAVFVILLFLISNLGQPNPNENGDDPAQTAKRVHLIVHAAAAVRKPVEEAAKAFEQFGVTIEVRSGASEALLAQLRISGQGDLFIPADDSYIDTAREQQLVGKSYDLAEMNAVLAVGPRYAGDRNKIAWADVVRADSRLVLANPDAAAIGRRCEVELSKQNRWAEVKARRPVLVGTITEACNAVKLGSADLTFGWDAVVSQYPELTAVTLPELASVTARVAAAVCSKSTQEAHARWFAQFLASRDGGRPIFAKAGFAPPRFVVGADGKADEDAEGDLVVYAGSMLMPAIERTIKEFEQREQVRVVRVYNGCGILVGQMRTGRMPDLYFACDPRFMDEVSDRFQKSAAVSSNRLVIAVPKGNPHGLKALVDLGKPGLKIGVGHEQQCALGAITKETFVKAGVYAAVRNNVKVESPTGDLLVNQLMTGSLDAVVCYISNVKPNEAKLDAVPIVGIPCSSPQQPIAIAKDSRKQHLATKLIEAIRTVDSRRRFESLGFGWEIEEPKQ